jgi:protoporphyrin/coproporphyrin ferrochelatase
MSRLGVLLLNFGEPEQPTMESVVPFLERIFSVNAALFGPATPEQIQERSHRLAVDRAPGLIEEYEAIGGSPLHRQALLQGELLGGELGRRGHDVTVFHGMQFTSPSIADAVRTAREAGVERLVALPVYPLAGPSTTMAALDELEREIAAAGWDVDLHPISGWHRHRGYLKLRADAVRGVLERDGVSLDDPRTKLVFSAHGTPMRYVDEGSRYVQYVLEFCEALARELGGVPYALGYQNHGNRPGVPWTQPEIDAVIAEIDADRVVVDPVSFMHEQSETLAELDLELREEALERGLGFHRVPIPFDAPAFIDVLADLVEAALDRESVHPVELASCRCRDTGAALCATSAAATAE